jgi:hypothetical protein
MSVKMGRSFIHFCKRERIGVISIVVSLPLPVAALRFVP